MADKEQNLHLSVELRHDLWLLARSWKLQLDASNGHTDRAGATRQLIGTLQQRPLPASVQLHLQRFTSLVVDDLLWLSPLDRTLLDALIDAFIEASPTGQVRLCLESNYHDHKDLEAFASGSRPQWEQADSRASLALRQGWYRRVEEGSAHVASADETPGSPDLSDLLATDGFFDLERGTGAVRLRSYGSELAEVRAIARSLKAKLCSGAQARDCAVAFPALDRYLPLVRDSFSAYGIPFVVEKGVALAVSPPVSAARQVLRLAAIGGGREELRTLFATNWLHFRVRLTESELSSLTFEAIPGEETADLNARASLHRALLDSVRKQPDHHASMTELHRSLLETGSIQGPPRRWLSAVVSRRLAKLRSELERRPSSEQTNVCRRRWTTIAREVRDIHAVDAFYQRVKTLKGCSDIAEAAGALKTLLIELELVISAPECAQEDAVLAEAHNDNQRALESFHKLLDEISTAANISDQICKGAPGTQPIRRLHELLEQAIDDSYYPSDSSLDGVSITGLRDLRGVDIPWLWLGGAVESELPRSAPASFLLAPSAQALIETRERSAEDRTLFFSLLRNFEQGEARDNGFLCVSWPKTVAGKDVPPSSLVQGLLALRLQDSPVASSLQEQCDEASLGAYWKALQQTEEEGLPALLCEQELLINPHVEEFSESFIGAPLRDRLALHRKLLTERSNLRGFGRWDGILGLGSQHRASSLRWLHSRIGGGHSTASLRFSATNLEAWARCPMRYFLRKVLRADEPNTWSPEPSPPEQGDLIHRVLERFFAERIEQASQGKLKRSGLAEASVSEIAAIKIRLRELSFEVADEVLGSLSTPYRDELLRQLTAGLEPNDPDNGHFAGRLSLFVDEESQDFLHLDPVATEFSFAPFNPAAVANQLDEAGIESSGEIEVLVTGTIDRLDCVRDGEAGLAGTTHAIYDYKTGNVGALKSIDLGLNLQPVVYAAASAPSALESTVTGYRRLPRQQESGRQRMAGSPNALDALKAQVPGFGRQGFKINSDLWPVLLRRVEWYGQLIASGFFPTTLAGSKTAGCKTCDYRRVCQHDALRVARTDTDQGGCGSFLPRPQQASEALRILRESERENGETQS
jgi:RecB family exonuclease